MWHGAMPDPEIASSKPVVHVVFHMSAAGTLRQAFGTLGCRERVIGFPEDLSYGPINPPDAGQRQEWIGRFLDLDFEEIVQTADLFWSEAMSPDIFPTVWVCRRNAAEYAAFLEFVWRKADTPFRVVDATNHRFAHRAGRQGTFFASALSTLHQEQIIGAGLINCQEKLRASDLEDYRAIWRQLRAENAPLRIVDDKGRLVSAPISYFDELVISCATYEWQKGARVIGETMAKLLRNTTSHCPSSMFFWGRVLALADTNAFEISGNDAERGTLVRRVKTSSNPL